MYCGTTTTTTTTLLNQIIIVNGWPTPQIAKLIEAGQAKYKNTPIKRQTYTTAVSLTN